MNYESCIYYGLKNMAKVNVLPTQPTRDADADGRVKTLAPPGAVPGIFVRGGGPNFQKF